MPLNQARLSAAIRTNLLGNDQSAAVDNDSLTAFCDAVASAVITEITANAVVLPALLVAPPGGGPVTGTGVVT